jgi:peptidyl-prolyl cis-trans isomerase A (cyclophilin A)/peptidyl-prolyl cis-trans isomerase B (cyclophilin B)
MIARMRTRLAIAVLTLAAGPALAQETLIVDDNVSVRIETTMGDIVVELNAIRAPETVQNFLQYVVDGHYEGTIFHRIATGFLIQGGGYLPDLTLKPAERTVFNESGNGLSNLRGTVGMARTNEAHSGPSQFYSNLADNLDLNPRPTRWGYAVFGTVVEGMDVVDQIGHKPTGSGGVFDRNVPVEPIEIENIVVQP